MSIVNPISSEDMHSKMIYKMLYLNNNKHIYLMTCYFNCTLINALLVMKYVKLNINNLRKRSTRGTALIYFP